MSVHPPYRYTANVVDRVTTNRLGQLVPLKACDVTEHGLYSEFLFLEPNPRLLGMRSWQIPDLGLRVISWLPGPECPADIEDFYVDIGQITVDGDEWHLVDHYLDLLVWTGKRVTVEDVDEFVAAVNAGYLDSGTAERALETSHRALAGITAHGYDLNAWLRHDHGFELF